MNKKKLPKAVTRTVDDMLVDSYIADASELRSGSLRQAPLQPSPPKLAAIGDVAPPDNVIGISPRGDSATGRQASAPAMQPGGAGRDRLKWLAQDIVERHANYSAIGGMVPLPVVNFAGVTTIIVRMVKMLCRLYGVPYQRDRARAIVIGIAGGAMPTGLSAVATSTLFYVVPGSNLLGLAVSSVAASACARSIGRVFIDHFEAGNTLADMPAIKIR